MSLSPADFQQPFYDDLTAQGSLVQPKIIPLVAIVWQHKEHAGDQAYSVDKQAIFDMLFGGSDSVADWMSQNSLRRFQIVPVSADRNKAVIGPINSTYSRDYYTGDNGGRDTSGRTAKNDGFGDNGYGITYIEAVRGAVAAGLDIASLDRNQDGTISRDELIILIIKHQNLTGGNIGFTRPLAQKELPSFEYLVVNGKKFIRQVSELYSDLPANFSGNLQVAIEEIMHQCAGIVDKYCDDDKATFLGGPKGKRANDDPFIPGQFSLTTASRRPVHLDAYDKLKLGWLNPIVVERSGVYKIRQSNITGDALILYNAAMGSSEFFIIENRTRGTSYDRYRDAALGDGLAIWHCIQDHNLDNWPRFATNLRRAQPSLFKDSWNDPFPLFAADHPQTSYLLTDYSAPQNLRFRNNVKSGIAIRNISKSGFEMTLEIDLELSKFTPARSKNSFAVSRTPDQIDTFWVGTDNKVHVAWNYFGQPWGNATINGNYPPPANGTTISAINRNVDCVDVFWVGNDGRIYCAYNKFGDTWEGHVYPIPGAVVAQGTSITCITRFEGHIDLFFAGTDGRLYVAWNDFGKPWDGNIAPIIGSYPPPAQGTGITAISRAADCIDIFWAGSDGLIYCAYHKLGEPWDRHVYQLPNAFPRLAPGTGIGAIDRTPTQIDIFFIGQNGKVYVAWNQFGKPWDNNVGEVAGAYPSPAKGATVSCISRAPDQVDICWAGSDGKLYLAAEKFGEPWVNKCWMIAGSYAAPAAGASLAAINRNPVCVDIIWAGTDGRMYDAYNTFGETWDNHVYQIPGSFAVRV